MSDTPASPKACPKCGAALPSAATSGLCPRCLMAEAMLPTQEGSASSSPGKALTPAELAPHFPQLEIVECLGRGGMGVVYKARQKSLNRFAALKLLAPERVTEAKFAQRFTHEAQALAALNHPNIVTIYDFGQAGGFYFLLMEFVDGVNLRQAMKAGRFTPEQALAIVPPVCEALQYAHEHGIVHRDIKPENLLLDREGRVKIADFGIAKMLGGDATVTSPDRPQAESAENEGTLASAAGTPQYMAPEQKAHRVTDHRADIYSLGVVLYELLTGELPADRLQPPSSRVRGMQIDVRLDEVVLRALEKTPELRYQTAGEFGTQVETIVSTPGASRREEAQVKGGSQKPEAPPRFSRAAIAGACWIPFIVLAAITWVSMMSESPRRHSVPWYVFDPGGGLRWYANLAVFIILPLGLSAPFGTTMLGWIAVSQIRRSAGKLYGLWLGVFDGLFFPLLALDALIIAADLRGRTHIVGPGLTPGVTMAEQNIPGLVVLLWTAIIFVVDFLIIRVVWRAVNRGLANDSTAQPPFFNTPRDYLALCCAALSGLMGAVSGMTGSAQLMALPILVLALLGIVLALPLRKSWAGRSAFGAGILNVVIGLIFAFAGPLLIRPGASSFAPALAARFTFGPIIERVIALGNEPNSFYSLDREEYAPGPPDFHVLADSVDNTDDAQIVRQRLWEWLTANDVDFLVQRNQGRPVLVLSDMVAFACNEADFDRWTPEALEHHPTFRELFAKQLRPNFQSPLSGDHGGKMTMVFQTRYERFGMVQVIGVSNDPPSVKIRYKLIASDANAAVSPPGSYRVAMLPKQQLVNSETALQKLNSKVAAQEAGVKAGTISAAEWQATKDKAGALNNELKRFIAEWSKFEAVIERHKASGVSQGEFKRAQNAVGTAEVRLRAVQALAEHDAGSATFGQVQERFVPANDEAPWPWFDVDTGKVIVTLHGDDEDVADFCASMTSGYRSLSTADETGFGTIALEAVQWETMAPGELAEKLKTATVDGASAEEPLPKTYGFSTRAGSVGVLQIIGIGDRPRGINIRYKLAQGGETKAAAVVNPAIAEAKPAFGPVMERVLPSGVPCREQYFQFRRGEVFIVGNGPGTSKEEAAYDEKKIDDAGGVDMSAISNEERIFISGRGCFFTQDVENLKWDSLTAEQVAHAMKRVRHVDGEVIPTKKDFPITYLFKTARGEVGIMEVMGVVDDKRDGWIEKGVKFHYKLVQGAGASAPAATPSLAFGPETRGLQAAVEVTPGEPFKLRIYVRNASDHGIVIDGAQYRQDDECLLLDGQGQPVPVAKVTHDIKIGMKGGYFDAGQVAVFESAGLSFQDLDKAPASAGYVAKARSGRYTLRMRLRLPGDDVPFAAGEHAWQGELETGPVAIEVKEPSTQPVAPVADSTWSAILGPVVERTVNDLKTTRENCALSFDSGKLLPAPPDITLDTLTNPSAQPAAVAWARDNQVDAVAFVTTEGDKVVKCGLLCPGLVVIRATNKDWIWDSADPQSLKEDFERAIHEWKFIPQIAEVTSDDQFPANYLILDTRTHRRGVLQIMGLADNPRSVKIRYRMVEGAAVKKKAL